MAALDCGLLLFEDNQVKAMDFGPRIAKITTWLFLIGMERKGGDSFGRGPSSGTILGMPGHPKGSH